MVIFFKPIKAFPGIFSLINYVLHCLLSVIWIIKPIKNWWCLVRTNSISNRHTSACKELLYVTSLKCDKKNQDPSSTTITKSHISCNPDKKILKSYPSLILSSIHIFQPIECQLKVILNNWQERLKFTVNSIRLHIFIPGLLL